MGVCQREFLTRAPHLDAVAQEIGDELGRHPGIGTRRDGHLPHAVPGGLRLGDGGGEEMVVVAQAVLAVGGGGFEGGQAGREVLGDGAAGPPSE